MATLPASLVGVRGTDNRRLPGPEGKPAPPGPPAANDLANSGEPATAVGAGKTHVPLYFGNFTGRAVLVALWAQFSSGPPGFPTEGWSYKAWCGIPDGQWIYPGDSYSNLFYYCAQDDEGRQWEGTCPATFTTDGITWQRKMRMIDMGDQWRSFDYYTLELMP